MQQKLKLPFASVTQLAEDLWVLEELGSNIFIVKGTERVLILDTAYGLTDLKAAAKALCGDLPVLLVNSHAHPDHNAGNIQFDRVYVGRYDEPNSHKIYTPEDKAHLIAFMGDRLKNYPFDADAWQPGPAPQAEPLTEGDVLDIGGLQFTVLETPGHTLGSIALFEPNKRWLFTGDTVLTWEVWGQLANSAALRIYAQSLDHMAEYADRVDAVFPAHTTAGTPYILPPRVLQIYAEGTRRIVKGKVTGRPYTEINPRFDYAEYVHFEIGGMAYDPKRI